MPVTPLLDWLEAREGIVALVGAGGKKTTMYRLAAEHPGRVAVTTTVRMAHFPPEFRGSRAVGGPEDLAMLVPEMARSSRRVAYAGSEDGPGRLGGVPLDLVARLHRQAGFDATLVKADGARMRWLKCPRQGEPLLPEGVSTVIPLASARVVGRRLDARVAHRPESCAALLDLAEGQTLGAGHLATLLAQLVARSRVSDRVRVVPVINMVDGPDLERFAREAARRLLELDPQLPRVVLAAMNRPEPLVAVVGR